MATYESNGWTALGDETRRVIVGRLAESPSAVGELADDLPISRPAVSQHLRVLKDAGLVTDRAVGTQRIYRLDPDGLGVLRAELDRFWTKALENYKQLIEELPKEDR